MSNSSVVRWVVFFKQKTAYEMRISDWSSDVCSSDLPQGYAIHRRRRRPLPEERPPTEAEQNGEEIADIVQIPERLVEQPDLTRHVWIFFHHYGRSLDEIARRLGISRRRAKRLRERAEYAIHGEPYPSLAFHIRFALMRKRLSLAWRWKIIRSAFYD